MDFCDFERGGNSSIQRVQHDKKCTFKLRIRIEECKRDVDRYGESLERDLVDRIGTWVVFSSDDEENVDVNRERETNPNDIRTTEAILMDRVLHYDVP